MKPGYLVGILIGLMLVYVAIFGLTMPNLFALTGANENYLTYTPYPAGTMPNPNSYLNVSTNSIIHQTSRTDISYLYADKGANHFGNSFTHTFDFQVTSATNGAMGMAWMLSNSVGGEVQVRSHGDIEVTWIATSSGGLNFYCRAFDGLKDSYGGDAWLGNLWSGAFNLNTKYFIRIVRSTLSITCTVTDATGALLTGGTLYDPLGASIGSGTGTIQFTLSGAAATSYEYIYACNVNDDGYSMTGTQQVENLNLNEAVSPSTYTVVASAGTGGSISPSGTVGPINVGTTQTFNIVANGGYQISNVVVDGSSQGAVSSYTFPTSTTAGSHTIQASFSPTGTTVYSTVTISVSGAGSCTPSSGSYAVGTVLNFAAISGTITSVVCTTGGTVSGMSVTVTANPTSITVYMTGGSTPPFDFNSFLTPAVRSIMMLVGVAIAGISAIMLFTGSKMTVVKPFGA